MYRPTPNQVLVLGLAIGIPPWFFSILSEFSFGGGFGFFAANATIALTVAYYASSDSRPMSDLMKLSLAFLGLLIPFLFFYSFFIMYMPALGLGIVVTLGALLGVHYTFRRTTEDDILPKTPALPNESLSEPPEVETRRIRPTAFARRPGRRRSDTAPRFRPSLHRLRLSSPPATTRRLRCGRI